MTVTTFYYGSSRSKSVVDICPVDRLSIDPALIAEFTGEELELGPVDEAETNRTHGTLKKKAV